MTFRDVLKAFNGLERKFRSVYKLGRLLGHGAFGTVHECFLRASGEPRAVKLLLKSRMKARQQLVNQLLRARRRAHT